MAKRLAAAVRHDTGPTRPPAHQHVKATAQPLRRRSSLRQGPAATRRQINRLAKMAAIVSLPVSIALVYAGHKRWHAITGWGFVGALATHMYIHRKNTFR